MFFSVNEIMMSFSSSMISLSEITMSFIFFPFFLLSQKPKKWDCFWFLRGNYTYKPSYQDPMSIKKRRFIPPGILTRPKNQIPGMRIPEFWQTQFGIKKAPSKHMDLSANLLKWLLFLWLKGFQLSFTAILSHKVVIFQPYNGYRPPLLNRHYYQDRQ